MSLLFPIGNLAQVWYLIVSIPDLCTFTYLTIRVVLSVLRGGPKSLPVLSFNARIIPIQSTGVCVQSPSIIPVPGYPLSLVQHLRSLDDRFSYPVV